MTTTYPIVEQRILEPVQPKRFSAGRRPLAELPQLVPGTMIVLKSGGQYVRYDESRRYTGAEDVLVNASAALVVNMRRYSFNVGLNIPSVSAADDFAITVVFHAQVEHPEIAAAHGPAELVGNLHRHLRADRTLLEIGESYSVEDIAEVRELVETRIESYCQVLPYSLPGISVTFAAAEVLTPEEVRGVEAQKRDEERADQTRQRNARREHDEAVRQTARQRELRDIEQDSDFAARKKGAEHDYLLDSAAESRAHESEARRTSRLEELAKQDDAWKRQRELLSATHEHKVRQLEAENSYELEEAAAGREHVSGLRQADRTEQRQLLEATFRRRRELSDAEHTFKLEQLAQTRRRQLQAYIGETENSEVDRLYELLQRGPDAMAAIALTRGELTSAAVERDQRLREADARAQMFKVLQVFQEGGKLDFVDTSAQALVNALVERVFGPRIEGADRKSVSGPKTTVQVLTEGELADDEASLDEDELDG